MNKVSFKEYEAAKGEIIQGVTYKETSELKDGKIVKSYATENNGVFYEVMENGIVEFWSDKHSTSRYYDDRSQEEIIAQYEKQIENLKKENARLNIERNQFQQNWNDSCLVNQCLHQQIKEAKEKLTAIAEITTAIKGVAA